MSVLVDKNTRVIVQGLTADVLHLSSLCIGAARCGKLRAGGRSALSSLVA